MSRLLVVVSLVTAGAALATPSGKRWNFDGCSTSCPVSGAPSAAGNRVCTSGRCLPEVRFAASIDNTGGMTVRSLSSAQVSYATALTTMRSAFERWTTPNVTTCGTSLMFAFASSTFTTPTGTAAANGSDGNNNVIFITTNWRYGSGTLGVTSTSFFPGQLLDADMELNNANTTWGVTGGGSVIDLESVVTHEAGHFVGIDHTTSGNAVMNPAIGAGQVKRNLLGPDLSDICGIYPGAAGGQGSTCTMGSQCTGGRVCEGTSGSSTLICTQDCTATGQSCPAGYTCQASTSGFACLPQVGVADQCRFCSQGSDCTTGICLTNGDGINWCSQSCTPGAPGQCTAGSECQSGGTSAYCVPVTACTNQCTPLTVATDCAPGYTCTSGTCTPTGATGDRCEVSGFCQQCNACAVDDNDPNIAFCRACCNNGSPLCTGCTATTCAPVGGEATSCFGISGRAERFCFPASGVGLCQACNTANPCSTGLTCQAGLCRVACNPASPGTCPACLAQGTSGICACTSPEVAEVNQPCSDVAPLRICRTGLRCVSGTCRQPCTVGTAGACETNFSCQTATGGTVCLPSGGTGGGGGGGTGGGAATGGGSATGGGAATGGGSAGGGGSGGAGGGPQACGPGNCNGCCVNNTCQAVVTPGACGAFGSVCVACQDGQACTNGQCTGTPTAPGCSCAQVELAPLLLLALGVVARRRRR